MESRGDSLTPMLSSVRTTYRDVSGTASTRETCDGPMHEEGMRSQETLRTLPNPWPEVSPIYCGCYSLVLNDLVTKARPHSALDRNPSGRIVHRESLSSEKTSRNSLSPSEPTVAYSPTGKAQMSWLSEIPEGSGSANQQSKGLPPLPMELPPAYSQRV
jgi:RNA recognition motif-containing protein